MQDRRGRGTPSCTFLDNIQKYLCKDIINLRLHSRDIVGWIIATMDIARGRFQLDGTR